MRPSLNSARAEARSADDEHYDEDKQPHQEVALHRPGRGSDAIACRWVVVHLMLLSPPWAIIEHPGYKPTGLRRRRHRRRRRLLPTVESLVGLTCEAVLIDEPPEGGSILGGQGATAAAAAAGFSALPSPRRVLAHHLPVPMAVLRRQLLQPAVAPG